MCLDLKIVMLVIEWCVSVHLREFKSRLALMNIQFGTVWHSNNRKNAWELWNDRRYSGFAWYTPGVYRDQFMKIAGKKRPMINDPNHQGKTVFYIRGVDLGLPKKYERDNFVIASKNPDTEEAKLAKAAINTAGKVYGYEEVKYTVEKDRKELRGILGSRHISPNSAFNKYIEDVLFSDDIAFLQEQEVSMPKIKDELMRLFDELRKRSKPVPKK